MPIGLLNDFKYYYANGKRISCEDAATIFAWWAFYNIVGGK